MEKPALVSYISLRADEFNAVRIEQQKTAANTAKSDDLEQRRVETDHVGLRAAWQCRQTLVKGERKAQRQRQSSEAEARLNEVT